MTRFLHIDAGLYRRIRFSELVVALLSLVTFGLTYWLDSYLPTNQTPGGLTALAVLSTGLTIRSRLAWPVLLIGVGARVLAIHFRIVEPVTGSTQALTALLIGLLAIRERNGRVRRNDLSHTLRTPLTILNGYLSMINEFDMTWDQFKKLLPLLQTKVKEVSSAVDELTLID